MTTKEKMAIHLRITGIVQGVGYRASFAARARAMQLSGWVKNRIDGSVEAQVAGPADSVDALVEWAREGPPAAQVRSIEVSPLSGAESTDPPDARFEVLPTD